MHYRRVCQSGRAVIASVLCGISAVAILVAPSVHAQVVNPAISNDSLTRAPATESAAESDSAANVPLDVNSEALRRAISEQATENSAGRERDRPRCSQVSLQRGRIRLSRVTAAGNLVRLEGCLGRPSRDDVQVWIRRGDEIERRRTEFNRTYAMLEASSPAYRGDAEVTLVRTRGDETYQLTPWVAVERVDPDADGDGHDAARWGGDDCADSDPNRYPGNAEVADRSHDEDCDPSTIDSGTRLHSASGDGDKDNDTFIDENVGNYGDGNFIPESALYRITQRDGRDFVVGTDCDDTRADVHPQQIEVCNARDDNCNGEVDEGLLNCSD